MSGGGRKPTSKEEQAAIRAALDAALDDVDDDLAEDEEEEDEDEEEDTRQDEREGFPDGMTIIDANADEKPPEGNAEAPVVLQVTGAAPNVAHKTEDEPPVPTALEEKLASAVQKTPPTEEGDKASPAAPPQEQFPVSDPPAKSATPHLSSRSQEVPSPRVSSSPPALPAAVNGPVKTKGTPHVNETEEAGTDRPFLGPPRPPAMAAMTTPQPSMPLSSADKRKKKKASPHHHQPPTDPDKLFMEMMEDMLLTEQEGVTGPDEMMMRLMQQLQEQLHDLEQEDGEESDDDDDDDAPPGSEAISGTSSSELNSEPPIAASGYVTPFEYEPTAKAPVEVGLPSSPPPPPPPPPSDSLPPTPISSVGTEENLPRSAETNPPAQSPKPVASSKPVSEKQTQAGEASKPSIPDPSADPKASKSSTKAPSAAKRKKESGRKPAQKAAPTGDDNQHDFDAAISKLLQGMAQQASMSDGPDAPSLAPDGTDEADLLKLLMKGLNGVAPGGEGDVGEGQDGEDDDFNADAMIDGMMEQLLSKDLMYDPMKQVAARFPKWLDERRNSLSAQELKQRQQQCDCFQKLVHVYETRPEDTAQLMALMQEVQEFGQPPAEIIHDIAPGLELDANGLPKLHAPLPPFGGGGTEDGEECRIM